MVCLEDSERVSKGGRGGACWLLSTVLSSEGLAIDSVSPTFQSLTEQLAHVQGQWHTPLLSASGPLRTGAFWRSIH